MNSKGLPFLLLSEAQFRRRTFHEPNLIRIWADPNLKSTPVDSDAELNSPNLIQFEPKKLVIIIIRYNNLCIKFGV